MSAHTRLAILYTLASDEKMSSLAIGVRRIAHGVGLPLAAVNRRVISLIIYAIMRDEIYHRRVAERERKFRPPACRRSRASPAIYRGCDAGISSLSHG